MCVCVCVCVYICVYVDVCVDFVCVSARLHIQCLSSCSVKAALWSGTTCILSRSKQ